MIILKFVFQKLRHENLVNLIEVFRRRKRLYLVFEFVDHTVLDDLEKYPNGLNEMTVRKIMCQVLRGVEFCHSHNVSALVAEISGYFWSGSFRGRQRCKIAILSFFIRFFLVLKVWALEKCDLLAVFLWNVLILDVCPYF